MKYDQNHRTDGYFRLIGSVASYCTAADTAAAAEREYLSVNTFGIVC